MSQSDYTEHIARISMGKDSLKMLDVIYTRGLPLDRVTTTDVWATDTIRAELPEVLAAKERIEEKLWQMYRISVEHLCAVNKDGSKRTYEQMFYHVPQRRSQTVQVERERESRVESGTILGFPDLWHPWCQAGLKRSARDTAAGVYQGISRDSRSQLVSKTQTCTRPESKASQLRFPVGARSSKSIMSEPLSRRAPHEARKKKYRGISRYRSGRACAVWTAERS